MDIGPDACKKLSISFEKWPVRRPGTRAAFFWSRLLALIVSGVRRRACSARSNEYEEDIYLALDGSADVVVNASVPALVALRGLDLSLDPAHARSIAIGSAPRIASAGDRGDAREPALAARGPAVHPDSAATCTTSASCRASRPFDWSTYELVEQGGRRRLQAGRRGVSAAAGVAHERRMGRRASSSRSGCTCRARSCGTTRAISRPTRPATSSAATSWRGSSS